MKKMFSLFIILLFVFPLSSQQYVLKLTPNDTTPYVTGAVNWYTANTSSTAYTDFLGDPGTGGVSRELVIWVRDNYSSFVDDDSEVELIGDTNLTLNSGDKIKFVWNPFTGAWDEDWHIIY